MNATSTLILLLVSSEEEKQWSQNLNSWIRKQSLQAHTQVLSIEEWPKLSTSDMEGYTRVLILDSRENFLFNLRYTLTLDDERPLVFLRYKAESEEKASIALDENRHMTRLNLEDSKQWHDSFCLSGSMLLKAETFKDLHKKSPSYEQFIENIFAKDPLGIPVGRQKLLESPSKPCLFLDRDGVINEDVSYLRDKKDLKMNSTVYPLIEWAKSEDWLVIVVSNQSGIARGILSHEELKTLTEHMNGILKAHNCEPDAWFYCPYYFEKGAVEEFTKHSVSRKPKPGLLLQAAEQFNIDFDRSYMVGDKASDKISLEGLSTLLVRGRYPFPPAFTGIFKNLGEILDLLESTEGSKSRVQRKSLDKK